MSYGVVFVCSGNICRSPLAEYVFRQLCDGAGVSGVRIASRGIGGWHTGEGADSRTAACALKHGVDLTGHAARKVSSSDISTFDLFVAMDRTHHRDLLALGVPKESLCFLRDYDDEDTERDVPDPYYGGAEGFENVHRMVVRCSKMLLADLLERGKLQGEQC